MKTTEEVEPEEHTPFAIKLTVIMAMTGLLTQFAIHCTYITSNYYSSPSVVLASSRPDGSRNIIDDYRYEKNAQTFGHVCIFTRLKILLIK